MNFHQVMTVSVQLNMNNIFPTKNIFNEMHFINSRKLLFGVQKQRGETTKTKAYRTVSVKKQVRKDSRIVDQWSREKFLQATNSRVYMFSIRRITQTKQSCTLEQAIKRRYLFVLGLCITRATRKEIMQASSHIQWRHQSITVRLCAKVKVKERSY